MSAISNGSSAATATPTRSSPSGYGGSTRAVALLTERERAVLELVAVGLSNKEIGRELGIAYHTVANHMTHLLRTLGATNRTEAALAWWRAQGGPHD